MVSDWPTTSPIMSCVPGNALEGPLVPLAFTQLMMEKSVGVARNDFRVLVGGHRPPQQSTLGGHPRLRLCPQSIVGQELHSWQAVGYLPYQLVQIYFLMKSLY